MNEEEAVDILGCWYRAGAMHRQKVVAIELFGIAYAADLDGLDLEAVTLSATGYRYPATLRRGVTLSRYVKIERERLPHWAMPQP